MAPKDFQQFFGSDFQGIDGQRSALEAEGTLVNRAINYEMSIGNSLRGRVGCQIAGGLGNFFAIFPRRYTRTQDEYKILYQTASGTYPTQTPNLSTTPYIANGETLQDLISLNQQAWILDTMDIVLTYVSGTYPFTWYTYVNGSNINFVIKANGVSILDTSLGDGISSYVTIWDLLNTIDGLTQLSVSRTTRGVCPPFAIVDGNQGSVSSGSTTYGTRQTITVDSGHTFTAGDIITFPPASFTGVTFYRNFIGGLVLSTTSTTITYVGDGVNLLDNAIIGYMGQPATCFPIDIAQSASLGNPTISFPYWRLIPEGDSYINNSSVTYGRPLQSFHLFWLGAQGLLANSPEYYNFYAPPVSENLLGNLYFTGASDPPPEDGSFSGNLLKIDGSHLVRAGLPSVDIVATPNASAGVLTGTFKYKALLRRYDAQGNVIEGVLSAASSATPAANNNIIVLRPFREPTDSSVAPYTLGTGFAQRSAFKHTTESPASGEFFYVDDNSASPGLSAFLQPGDPICLLDNVVQLSGGGGANTGLWLSTGPGTTALGALHRTVCTDYCAQATTISPTISSIRVADSSGYTIPDNTWISTGDTIVIYRTTDGGNQYYKLAEIPYTGYETSLTITDNVNDSILTTSEQLIEPEIGKEHDPPPPCTLVCQHNGGLVVARNPVNPNTVTVSTAEGIEYFPLASNSFDIPSTQSGSITAIASDSDDRLAVFKDRAYYDVVGDVDSGLFAVNIRNEGDYGITSQASLVRLPFGLLGLSKNGWVVIQDGLLDPLRYEEVNARVINQDYQFAWATAVNDAFNRQYICTIPQVSGEPVSFVFDYSRRKNNPSMVYTKTMERSYTTQIDQAGGCALIQDTLYHLSQTSPYGVFRRLRRFNGNSPHLGDGDSFIDNTNTISYILETAPINRGDPENLRQPIRARVWSIPNDYVVEGWVPFSVLLETGASPLAAFVGSPNPQATSTTLTFSASNNVMKDAKLVGCKTLFYIVRLTTNTIRTAPFITGISVLYADDYAKEDLIK